jgi:hypothetical protein
MKERHAGFDHGRQLPRKQRDVLVGNLAGCRFCFLSLVTLMPWRRKAALATDSLAARMSPRTTLPALFLPSQEKLISFGPSFFASALPAVAIRLS